MIEKIEQAIPAVVHISYKTADGLSFSTHEEAQAHEQRYEFFQTWRSTKVDLSGEFFSIFGYWFYIRDQTEWEDIFSLFKSRYWTYTDTQDPRIPHYSTGCGWWFFRLWDTSDGPNTMGALYSFETVQTEVKSLCALFTPVLNSPVSAIVSTIRQFKILHNLGERDDVI